MQNLLLTEGDIVKFQYTKLLKGQYVKLRPQTKDFLDISNPKAVLETTLRTYTCLTVGDSILINYNNKRQGVRRPCVFVHSFHYHHHHILR